MLRNIDCILPSHRIGNQENFMGMNSRLYFLQFLQKVLLHMQASRRIQYHHIIALPICPIIGFFTYGNGIRQALNPLHINAGLLPQPLELLLRSRPVYIDRSQ